MEMWTERCSKGREIKANKETDKWRWGVDVVFQPLDMDLFSLHAAVPLLLLKGREQNISEVFPHSCAYEYV